MTGAYELSISVNVNGRQYERVVPGRLLLSDFLRRELGRTGTHVGCEHGICGACNVHVDGELVRSCLMLAVQTDGQSVTTVEGVASDGVLHPVQEALLDHDGLQCGFCTPGVVMTLVDLVGRHGALSEDELRHELAGNLCRCTGYQGIIAAARSALDGRRTL